MSPLTVVVPRLMVPEISPQTRTAQDNFEEQTTNALEIFLSKLQKEISIILITWQDGPASLECNA